MITIEEKKAKKVSGITSLFINFDYKKEIVETLKTMSGKNITVKSKNKVKTYTWELPMSNLSKVLDILSKYDTITLTLLDENKEQRQATRVLEYKTKPFEYQLEGIEYGLNNDKWLLLDEAGLGKSLQVIYLAEELKKQRHIEHCLIICGLATLRTNWRKEIQKHSNLSCIIIGEQKTKNGNIHYATVPERAEQLRKKIDEFFIIINIESLRDKEVIDAILNSKNKIDMIAFDEVHKAKNIESKQGKNLLKLKDYTYKVAMTGTLLMNNPLDLYLPLKWIDVEKAEEYKFDNEYCVYGGYKNVVGFKNLDLLQYILNTCSLRRTLESVGLQLPSRTVINEVIEMNEEHKDFYNDVAKGIKESCDLVELKSKNVLALTTRLRQATSCPNVLTSDTTVVSTKIERALELIQEIVSNGNKVVVFSVFKAPIFALQSLLSDYKVLVNTGDTKDNVVSNNVDLFQNDDSYQIFLATTDKCGTGITLNKAHYGIFIDCPWTYALQEQCEKRIHRIGSEFPVIIYRIICKDTIDEKVNELLERKKALSEYVIDNNESDENKEILGDMLEDEDDISFFADYLKEL